MCLNALRRSMSPSSDTNFFSLVCEVNLDKLLTLIHRVVLRQNVLRELISAIIFFSCKTFVAMGFKPQEKALPLDHHKV